MKSWLEKFERESLENQVLVARERLALEVAMALGEYLENSGMTKAEFARKIGKSKAYVTRLLQGNYNLTLGTIAEVSCYLGARANFSLRPRAIKEQVGFSLTVLPISTLKKIQPCRWDRIPEGGDVYNLPAQSIAG